jgi:hypothetical protein
MHKVVVQGKHLSGSTYRSQFVLMKLLVGIHIASAYTFPKGTLEAELLKTLQTWNFMKTFNHSYSKTYLSRTF